MNDDWATNDGGNIRLYLKDNTTKDLYPNSGKCVFFKSNKSNDNSNNLDEHEENLPGAQSDDELPGNQNEEEDDEVLPGTQNQLEEDEENLPGTQSDDELPGNHEDEESRN
mgnify:CR=1 FL=1